MRVTSGDLANLRGRVTNVLADGRVEVMPTQLGLNDALTFDAAQLCKFFEVGFCLAAVLFFLTEYYSCRGNDRELPSLCAGNRCRLPRGS